MALTRTDTRGECVNTNGSGVGVLEGMGEGVDGCERGLDGVAERCVFTH